MATPPPVLRGEPGYASISDRVSAVVLARSFTWRWTVGLLVSGTLALAFIYGVVVLFVVGVGLFGVNIPAAWGFPIVNVVWWIGIGHAGTLISAVLLLTLRGTPTLCVHNPRSQLPRGALRLFCVCLFQKQPVVSHLRGLVDHACSSVGLSPGSSPISKLLAWVSSY